MKLHTIEGQSPLAVVSLLPSQNLIQYKHISVIGDESVGFIFCSLFLKKCLI